MINVTKADGTKQVFEKWKIIRTCLRLGANEKQARIIADKVEKKIYEGIETRKILELIHEYLAEFKPEIKYQIDLRESVCLLRPKPDFEIFVSRVLEEHGYKVERNLKVEGKCIQHEIDAIATKNDEKIYVEIKHHLNPHVFTGIDVFLKAYASFIDLVEGYKIGKAKTKIDNVMVICSTKLSEHAMKYANCNNILYIAWKAPEEKSLEKMIQTKKLFPITFLKGLEISEQDKLINANIVLLSELAKSDPRKLAERTGLNFKRVNELIKRARDILGL